MLLLWKLSLILLVASWSKLLESFQNNFICNNYEGCFSIYAQHKSYSNPYSFSCACVRVCLVGWCLWQSITYGSYWIPHLLLHVTSRMSLCQCTLEPYLQHWISVKRGISNPVLLSLTNLKCKLASIPLWRFYFSREVISKLD